MGNSANKNRSWNRSNKHNNMAVEPDNKPSIQVGIEYPPDHVFKFKQNRIAPSQEVWGQGSVSYVPDHAEYIKGEGSFVYYRGLGEQPAPPFPSRCVAPVQAILATNAIKRITINVLRFISSPEARLMLIVGLIGKKKRQELATNACKQYNHIADSILQPYYLEEGYYCRFVTELQRFTTALFVEIGVPADIAKKTGEIIGLMFEYDNAYRFRLHDILNDTTKEQLKENLPKEIQRLLEIEQSREMIKVNDMTDKFRSGAKVLEYAWKIPSLRKTIRKAIDSIDFDRIKMDEADIYHTCLYGDYNVRGKTLEERLKILEGYHGTDQRFWPPRIMVKQN